MKGKLVTISLTPDEQDQFFRLFGHQSPSKEMLSDLVKKCALSGVKMQKRLINS